MKLWIKIFFTSLIVFIMIIVIYNTQIRDVPVALGFLSVEIAIISILFASISIEIAKKSKEIALDSDEKMKEISNMNFLETLSDFEYTRMKAIGNLPIYKQQRNNELRRNMIGTYISRSLSECERIAELNKDHIKIRHEQKFVNLFCASMEILYTGNYYSVGWNDLPVEQQNQILMMYSIIRRYERLPTEESRLVSIRESFMGQESNESESDFYKRMIQDYNLENYPYS